MRAVLASNLCLSRAAALPQSSTRASGMGIGTWTFFGLRRARTGLGAFGRDGRRGVR